MEFVYVVAMFMSAWRLAELLYYKKGRSEDGSDDMFSDFIFIPILKYVSKRCDLIANLIGCIRCLSVWTGLIATLTFFFFPMANLPLAISFLILRLDKILGFLMPNKNGVFVEIVVVGNGQVGIKPDWGTVDPKISTQALRMLLAQMDMAEKHNEDTRNKVAAEREAKAILAAQELKERNK